VSFYEGLSMRSEVNLGGFQHFSVDEKLLENAWKR